MHIYSTYILNPSGGNINENKKVVAPVLSDADANFIKKNSMIR